MRRFAVGMENTGDTAAGTCGQIKKSAGAGSGAAAFRAKTRAFVQPFLPKRTAGRARREKNSYSGLPRGASPLFGIYTENVLPSPGDDAALM